MRRVTGECQHGAGGNDRTEHVSGSAAETAPAPEVDRASLPSTAPSHGVRLRGIRRRRGTSTKSSSGFRSSQPGPRSMSCSAPSACTATPSTASATVAPSPFSSSQVPRTNSSSDQSCRAPPLSTLRSALAKRCRTRSTPRAGGTVEARGGVRPRARLLRRSLYVPDPNGLLLEFTVDAPNVDAIVAERRATAPRIWRAGSGRPLQQQHVSASPSATVTQSAHTALVRSDPLPYLTAGSPPRAARLRGTLHLFYTSSRDRALPIHCVRRLR